MNKNRFQLITEQQLLKQLNIPDFRHLTKDHVMDLASNMHKLDPEVAKKVLEQFPDFSKSTLDGLTEFKNLIVEILMREEKSTEDFIHVCDREIDFLESCLTEDLTFEQKIEILDRIADVRNDVSIHTKEKRRFHLAAIATTATVILGGIGMLLASLGGDVNLPKLLPYGNNQEKKNK